MVFRAVHVRINSRSRLAKAGITQIALHDQAAGFIDFCSGQNHEDIRLHAGMERRNRAAVIGRVQSHSDQAQGHNQQQSGEQEKA